MTSKMTSEELHDILVSRSRCQIKYPELAEFDQYDDKLIKLYLINVGDPNDSNRKPHKKKSASSYVGCTRMSISQRVRMHNDMLSSFKNQKTKNGLSRWILCMIIFIPDAFNEKTSKYRLSKVVRDYWKSSHGIRGKIRRAKKITEIFSGLKTFIPDNYKDYISSTMANP